MSSKAVAFQIDRLRCLVNWADDVRKVHAGEPDVTVTLKDIEVLASVIRKAADVLEKRL
jgi:hypothetical protein